MRYLAKHVITSSVMVVLLAVLFFGANYGMLLYMHIAPPPIVNIQIGRFQMLGFESTEPACDLDPCHASRPNVPSNVYDLELFINSRDPVALPQILQIVRITRAPP